MSQGKANANAAVDERPRKQEIGHPSIQNGTESQSLKTRANLVERRKKGRWGGGKAKDSRVKEQRRKENKKENGFRLQTEDDRD